MKTRLWTAVALCLAFGSAGLGGCGAADTDSYGYDSADVAGDEEIGEVDQSLGEPGCGTVRCTLANSCVDVNVPACNTRADRTSPNANYGTAACRDQFIARDTSPPRSGGRLYAHWRLKSEQPNRSNCSQLRVETALYARVGSSSAARLIGTAVYRGEWRPEYGLCVPRGPRNPPGITPSSQLREVRTTAKATLGGEKLPIAAGFIQVCG